MFMSGTFGGNLYVYFAWNGKDTISEREQVTLALILGVVTVVGSFIFLVSRSIPEPDRETEQSIWEACVDYFKSAWHMSQKLPVLLMMPSMAFQGFEMAFYQGIFPTCIGASNQLPNAKRLVGLVS